MMYLGYCDADGDFHSLMSKTFAPTEDEAILVVYAGKEPLAKQTLANYPNVMMWVRVSRPQPDFQTPGKAAIGMIRQNPESSEQLSPLLPSVVLADNEAGIVDAYWFRMDGSDGPIMLLAERVDEIAKVGHRRMAGQSMTEAFYQAINPSLADPLLDLGLAALANAGQPIEISWPEGLENRLQKAIRAIVRRKTPKFINADIRLDFLMEPLAEKGPFLTSKGIRNSAGIQAAPRNANGQPINISRTLDAIIGYAPILFRAGWPRAIGLRRKKPAATSEDPLYIGRVSSYDRTEVATIIAVPLAQTSHQVLADERALRDLENLPS